MGYRIEYPGREPVAPQYSRTGVRLRSMVAAAIFVFAVTVRLLWPEGPDALRQMFLPGALTVTEQAFSQLMTDLREGDSLEYAVDVFCRRVVDGDS